MCLTRLKRWSLICQNHIFCPNIGMRWGKVGQNFWQQVENQRKKKTITPAVKDLDIFSEGGKRPSPVTMAKNNTWSITSWKWWQLYIRLSRPSLLPVNRRTGQRRESNTGSDQVRSVAWLHFKWSRDQKQLLTFVNQPAHWQTEIDCDRKVLLHLSFHQKLRRCRLLRPRVTLNVGGVRFQVCLRIVFSKFTKSLDWADQFKSVAFQKCLIWGWAGC